MTVLFPTLIELCGLPAYDKLHGRSAADLVATPDTSWNQPALMTYGYNNHAVRSERWRYIRYADGTEELYDHKNDPNEWTNLASNPTYASVIKSHKKHLPATNAEPKPNLHRKH
jgi:iduronate 2-sulfatase